MPRPAAKPVLTRAPRPEHPFAPTQPPTDPPTSQGTSEASQVATEEPRNPTTSETTQAASQEASQGQSKEPVQVARKAPRKRTRAAPAAVTAVSMPEPPPATVDRSGWRPINTRIDPALHKRLRLFALLQEVTVEYVVNTAVTRYLDEAGATQP